MARIEAKLDVALSETRAKLHEHGRRLGEHDASVAQLRFDLSQLHTQQAVSSSELKAIADQVVNRSRSWPAVAAVIVSAIAVFLTLAAQLYGA